MVTTSENPATAVIFRDYNYLILKNSFFSWCSQVKLLTSRSSCAIQGCMFGHYRTVKADQIESIFLVSFSRDFFYNFQVNNRVICVLQKPKHVEPKRRMSLRQRKAQKAYVFEVPDQDFHFVSNNGILVFS